ncbi:MAG: hypothetical protein ACRDGW_04820 [Actinomycetota bacterium]
MWITAAGTIGAIASVDAAVAGRIFGSSDAIALGGWPGARTGRAWASSERFADDVRAGTISDDVTVVMYNPESWDATPLPERLDPTRSIERFCALARANGYSAVVTPHPNLVCVARSPHEPLPGETRESAYLRSGIIEASVANADVYETQAQRLQRDPAAYRAFVRDTVLRARGVNRDVQVISGLSTHPGYAATPGMLRDAWTCVRDLVDGH